MVSKTPLKALDLGACEKVIVYENLNIVRYTLKDIEGEEVIAHVNPELPDKSWQLDKKTGTEMEIVKEESFLEWLAENYKNYGAELDFVTDKSSEGAQFVQGFGGIGAILRYKVNFEQLADESSEDEYYDDDDDSFI